jgi:hypothetical protein
MERLLACAAASVRPALAVPLVDSDGNVDGEALRLATVTVERLLGTVRGPMSAVYVTWDTHGQCRYVGSVRRPSARSAVRSRLGEHLRQEKRRSMWYAVTVLPVRPDLGLGILRACEGIAARRLCPVDGTYHPVPSTECSLIELVGGWPTAASGCAIPH